MDKVKELIQEQIDYFESVVDTNNNQEHLNAGRISGLKIALEVIQNEEYIARL